MDASHAIRKLKSMSSRKARASMESFGISTGNSLGVRVPDIRAIAKESGKDHALAVELWDSGIHEARILSSMVEVPGELTEREAERRVAQIDSWDICDSFCSLLSGTGMRYRKPPEWSKREEEYVKRAAFALIAYTAVHDKQGKDKDFMRLLAIIERESWDGRNFVRKAVNWALREIGKRNRKLNRAAISAAERIRAQGTRPARWIAADALRELRGGPVQGRLNGKN